MPVTGRSGTAWSQIAGLSSTAKASVLGISSEATLDADVSNWVSRVATAGGTVSPATQLAASNFAKSLKTAGIWSGMQRLNLMCGDFLASFVPLINTGGSTIDTNVNLVSGDYTEALGMQSDGMSKYLRTGLVPSATVGHLSVYLRTAQAQDLAAKIPIGSWDMGVSQLFMLRANRTGTAGMAAGAVAGYWGGPASNAGASAGSGGMSVGHWGVTRRGNSDCVLLLNGSSVGTNFTGNTPASNGQELYVMTNNAAGTANAFLDSGSRVAGYSVGDVLSPTAATAFYNAMQAFQTALGRQV